MNIILLHNAHVISALGGNLTHIVWEYLLVNMKEYVLTNTDLLELLIKVGGCDL